MGSAQCWVGIVSGEKLLLRVSRCYAWVGFARYCIGKGSWVHQLPHSSLQQVGINPHHTVSFGSTRAGEAEDNNGVVNLFFKNFWVFFKISLKTKTVD